MTDGKKHSFFNLLFLGTGYATVSILLGAGVCSVLSPDASHTPLFHFGVGAMMFAPFYFGPRIWTKRKSRKDEKE